VKLAGILGILMIFFIFNRFIFSAIGGSGFSTFQIIRRLLAFLRACLSTLLYKSIKQMCLFDFDNTNVYPEIIVSK